MIFPETEWTVLLREDERPWLGHDPLTDTLLYRLAAERAAVASFARMMEDAHVAPEPMSEDEQAAIIAELNSPEVLRDQELMSQCDAAGGHTWEPYTDNVIFHPFPAIHCSHCGCSTRYEPLLPVRE